MKMVLLQWCTLEPSERGGLAAIRFSAPVRIQTIRIFPADERPFSQCPEIVRYAPRVCMQSRELTVPTSRTAPPVFTLDVYFNAQPITGPNVKEKPKPSNALVPTSIAYAGGQREYAVNMGPEVRLAKVLL